MAPAYINPDACGQALPNMSSYLQLLRNDEHTRAHRHVAGTGYHVAEGGSTSIIGGQRYDWEAGDTLVVPAWAWHEHASSRGTPSCFPSPIDGSSRPSASSVMRSWRAGTRTERMTVLA